MNQIFIENKYPFFLINLFYTIKPLIPRRFQIALRRMIMTGRKKRLRGMWPIFEHAPQAPPGWSGWPRGKKFALLLCHDVDNARGRNRCIALMEIERKLGFLSSFNFVPEGYRVPQELRQTLEGAGFEIGVHGLKHDGKLFSSRKFFLNRAPRINSYLKSWGAVGFYSPSMYHNLEWISELDIEYSCSTFDSDPFEPQPEGTGNIFPFLYWNRNRTRNYVEIPYTLPQDHTLFIIFQERNIDIWLDKLEWVASRGGLVRLNTHPDYMSFGDSPLHFEEYPVSMYIDFLNIVKTRYNGQYWHVLPRDLAAFWRQQAGQQPTIHLDERIPSGPAVQPEIDQSANRDREKSVLIVVENASLYRDPRVKNEAKSLSGEGWNVHVICPKVDEAKRQHRIGNENAESIYNNIHVHEYPMKMGEQSNLDILKEYVLSIYHIMRISWRLWRKNRFSVIHICNPPDFLFIFAFVYKLMGSKVIFDHHDLFPEMILIRLRGITGWLSYRIAKLLEYLTFRTADIVLSTNESYKEIAVTRGNVNPQSVFVVRNGPWLSRFFPEEPNPILKNGFPFMASYAGIMNKEDGVTELIDVIDHIVKDLERKDIIFYLLGHGGTYNIVVNKVTRLKLSEFVKLPGMIYDSRKFREILSTSDVLLAPERSNPLNDKSTFIKIAEYMAIGKPIVAYDLKETRYTAGEAALYAASGDIKGYAKLILNLMDDPDLAGKMGKAGRRKVAEAFSWENQSQVLRAAYHAAHKLGKQ